MCSLINRWNLRSAGRKYCCLCPKIDTLTFFKLMSGLRFADMDATVNVVDLTAVMPGERPIAQLYTDSGTAVDRAVREKDRQSAAKILKRTSFWWRISRTRCCPNTIELHQPPLIASLEIALKRTDIQRRTRTKSSYLQIDEIWQYLN